MATTNKHPVKKTVSVKSAQPKGPFHFTGRYFNLIFILSVIGLCFVLYGNSIPNEFSLDDEFVLHNDTIVAKGIKGIPELFKTRYAWDQKGSYGYRPIVKATFSLEYVLFKDSPHWGHFINILIYAFLCIFLFYFFRKILHNHLSDYFLLIALALFITHPIHTEVVDSLKNRDEMLVLIFGFYCCYAFLKCFETNKLPFQILWVFSGCISFWLGTLSKTSAFIFIPILMLILFFFSSGGIRAAGISFLCILVSFVLEKKLVIKQLLPHTDYHRTFVYIENPPAFIGEHWYQKFPLAFSTVWFYISKLVFPKDLVSYYGYDAFDSFPKWADFGVIAGILLTVFFIYIVIKNVKNKTPFLFVLLLFLGTLFPYTDILQVGPGIVAERFMFIPSIAFVLLLTYLLFYLLKIPVDKKPAGQPSTYAYAFTVAVCVIFTARVIARNPDWKTHQSVYLHDSKEAPRSAKLQALLAATYLEEAQRIRAKNPQEKEVIDSLFLEGEKGYQQSVDIYPGYGTSWNNLGMIQYTLYVHLRSAISDFKKALEIDSDYSEAWFNMGACYEMLGNKVNDTINSLRHDSTLMAGQKTEGNIAGESLNGKMEALRDRRQNYRSEAERCYLKTIKLKPTSYVSYIYLSRLYFSEGKFDKVIEFDDHALKNGYESDVIYVTKGNAYLMLNDTNNAVINYEKSLRFYDKNYYVCGFLRKYYYHKGDMEKARLYSDLYDSAMLYKQSHTPVR